MKLTQTNLFALVLVVTLAGAGFTLSAGPAAQVSAQESGLGDAMQVFQSNTKKLDKALDKGELDNVVKLTLELQKAAYEAKTQTPEKAATISDAKEKAAFVLGFRKDLITMQKALLDLELATLDGKADEAKKIFAERVKPMKKDGHARYKD